MIMRKGIQMNTYSHADILGVSLQGLSIDALAAAYRAASKRTHPDVGGSAEAQQRVVAAYEALRPFVGRLETHAEAARESERRAAAAKEALAKFDVSAFLSYARGVLGLDLEIIATKTASEHGRSRLDVRLAGGVWFVRVLLSYDAPDLSAYVYAYNGRKVLSGETSAEFESILPPEITQNKKERPHKKEDAVCLVLALGGDFHDYKGCLASIPLAGGAVAQLQRCVSMRQASWYISNIRYSKQRIMLPTTSYWEDKSFAPALCALSKRYVAGMTLEDILLILAPFKSY